MSKNLEKSSIKKKESKGNNESHNEKAAKLEEARKRHTEQYGHKSFKRQRGGVISKEIFGNCPDVALRYEKIGRLGEGTYGVVYKARDKETNAIVALKRCLPHFEATDGFPITTLREISILRSLRFGYGRYPHPSIVELLDVAVSSKRGPNFVRNASDDNSNNSSRNGSGVFLVFEYCEFDLAHIVDEYYATHSKSPFNEAHVKSLALQLLEGLSFLHSRNVLHRDIKLSNLLYSQHVGSDPRYPNEKCAHLRIADFGLARKASISPNLDTNKSYYNKTELTPKVVSLWYRPPELLFGSGEYNQAVDNWGAGCAIAELLEGVPLLKGRNELDQISKLFDLLGPPNRTIWPDLTKMPLVIDKTISIPNTMSFTPSKTSLLDRFEFLSSGGLTLLSNLLQYDYKKRFTSDEALECQYFKENPFPSSTHDMPFF